MSHPKVAILYHADCPDGFGGAYAAWKKFGEGAEYIPVEHHQPPPEHLAGREVYVIDFSYPLPIMEKLAAPTKSFTVLDHHEGARAAVEAMPNHVYDANRSGATIAWDYFHPGTPRPILLRYVEDGDLYRFELEDARALLAYCYTKPFTFSDWETLSARMEDPEERARMKERGEAYVEYGNLLMGEIAKKAWLVSFEGYEVLAVDAPSAFASHIGHALAKKKPPFGMIIRTKRDGVRVSLRGDGSVDVAALARKYGGNGHPNAAAFPIPLGTKLPFEAIHHHDNPRH